MDGVRGTLVGRDGELDALRQALEGAAAGRGSVVCIEAEAGMGKSALLRGARDAGAAAGLRVRGATGGEVERDFAFGIVRQLLEPHVSALGPADRDALLVGAAAFAAPIVTGAPVTAEPSAEGAYAVLHGLYWLVASLAEREPLALLVDDAHWSDEPSLRALLFLARRIGDLPVALVVACRPDEPGAPAELLDGLTAIAREVLRPAALDEPSVRALLEQTMGEPSPEVLAAALEATGGQPLLLTELLRTLAASGGHATADEVRAAVPTSVRRSVDRRLGRLAPEARRVARALAMLGEARVAAVLTDVCDLAPAQVAEALDTLERAGLVDGDAFVHPLLRAATAAGTPAGEASLLHLAAARSLRRHGAPAEEVAVQLLATPALGEPWVAPLLRASGRRALAQGAPEAAAARLRRALVELGQADDDRPGLLLDLADVELGLGDPLALEHLDAAARDGYPRVAAQALRMRIGTGHVAGAEGSAALSARIEEVLAGLDTERDADLVDALRAEQLNALVHDPACGAERARRIAAAGDRAGAAVLGARAWDGASGDRTQAEVVALATRAGEGRPFSRLPGVEQPGGYAWAVAGLIGVEAAAEADVALRDAEATARATGSRLAGSFASYLRASWAVRFGDLAAAEALAEEALAHFAELGGDTAVKVLQAMRISAAVRRGRLDAAAAIVAGLPPDHELLATYGGEGIRAGRAELHVARGHGDLALGELDGLDARVRAYGWKRFPTGAHAALRTEALVLVGRRVEARELARAEAAEARRRGVPGMEAEALLALGLAEEDDAARIGAFEDAVAAANGSAVPLARARASAELGAALRRAGRRADARRHLAVARDVADRIRADGLLARATEELLVAGGRPRRVALSGVEALTPSERRVAGLAAAGMTNRQIAEALFVTRKTVESTLGQAFAKLGVRSRTQLPELLGADAVPPPAG